MADLVSDATGVVADVALIEAHSAMAALHLAGARATAGLAGQVSAAGAGLEAVSGEGSTAASIGHDISHIGGTLSSVASTAASWAKDDLDRTG